MMNITIVPYGNAREDYGGSIICQHGAAECLGNMYEACSQALYPNITDFYPFFNCLELSENIDDSVAQQCAEGSKLSYEKLSSCTTSQQGTDLIKANMKATDGLNPPHTYVPWITVNGKVLSDPSTLLASVCAAFTGTKPAACSQLEKEAKPCYRDA